MEKQLGYWDDVGVLHITADILAVCNEAAQGLSGDIVWSDYEYYKFGPGAETIQIFGLASDGSKIAYRLIVERVGDNLMTAEDEAPCYTTCSTLNCCSKCHIDIGGSCYCYTVQSGCSSGSCETRTFGWMGITEGFSNYCRNLF